MFNQLTVGKPDQLKTRSIFYVLMAAMMALGIGLSEANLNGHVLAAEKKGTDTIKISGAGATFPFPIYSKWAEQYKKRSRGAEISYRGIGSGGGIAQIKAKAVDFGGSDRPLKLEDLEKFELIQFPMIIGGIVPVYNIKGIRRGKLKLTPELLSAIFLGEIENWSDRRIRAVNSGLRLPDQEIRIAHRADGSGSTWIFTTYLSKVSPTWKEKVGAGKAVSWPTGVGGKGNPGVSELVKTIPGAIGYVEFAYAIKDQLKYVQLQNQDGEFVKPTIATFQAAAKNADWKNAPGYFMDLTDQPGERSWPITGTSYILIPKKLENKQLAEAMLKFFSWCYKNGKGMAISLNYVPIPESLYTMVEDLWAKQVTADGDPVWNVKKVQAKAK